MDATAQDRPTAVGHPLDPLSPDELQRVVEIARNERSPRERVRFVNCDLLEPEKADLRTWRDGGPRPAREALLILLDADAEQASEAVISLDEGRITSWTDLDGLQPAITADEFFEAAAACKSDPGYLEALAKRGIEGDLVDLVHVEPWSLGRFEAPGKRLARCISWLRSAPDDVNPYARPIGRLLAILDLNRMEVVRIDDHGALPVPPEGDDYRNGGGAGYRDDLKPIDITQRDGPSFTLEGHEMRWQKWRFRIGFSQRESLVLHEIAYEDNGEVRPICHRASIAELVIPYGDPNPTVHFKNVFDIGEYGVGPLVNALELGCDCLGEITYLDATTLDTRGNVVRLPNAICIHEEDYGLLWKHTDDHTGRTDLARSRRLVVSCIATVGNYEYGFFWYLYQDGTIQFEGKLTGIVHTAGVPVGEDQRHSTLVKPGVAAGYHQHFFTARLDMDVDGEPNVAYEVESAVDPISSDNEEGTAFSTHRLTFERESQAKRQVSPLTARRWRVENPARRNRMGEPVTWELVPGDNVLPMAHPDSQFRQRARFLDHHLWVTPYRRDERFPAGDHPNQHEGGDGLPRWTAEDRGLENEDVVLWYTFGAHHIPRLEDWPVMPIAYCGFHLRPVGFFDRSPALDVPPPHPAHCHHNGH
ncbi:MAG: primary-amine oxidase [Gaiellales bacterium]|jgi:primary-amine oxidase|nr:primary-amine oxidase [Gaiellales bacterium]